MSTRSLTRHLRRHLVKLGVVKRRVTRVVQNTRYDLTVKQQYVQYINEQIKIGGYRPQDIVSIDETNFDFDQASEETLADRGARTIGCDVTVSANLCTFLFYCIMSGEEDPPLYNFQGQGQEEAVCGKSFPPSDLNMGI
jgi:hypothetical protein